MSLIMEQIKPEHPELFALKFGKIAETDFVYTLASPNINQSAPNLVKMYVTIRSRTSWTMNLIGAELSELLALEFAKIVESDFVYTQASTKRLFRIQWKKGKMLVTSLFFFSPQILYFKLHNILFGSVSPFNLDKANIFFLSGKM